jgi:hypothetical protein
MKTRLRALFSLFIYPIFLLLTPPPWQVTIFHVGIYHMFVFSLVFGLGVCWRMTLKHRYKQTCDGFLVLYLEMMKEDHLKEYPDPEGIEHKEAWEDKVESLVTEIRIRKADKIFEKYS